MQKLHRAVVSNEMSDRQALRLFEELIAELKQQPYNNSHC